MVERAEVAVGDVVDNKYRIESRIGQGAMGVVYAARHIQLDARVALKFLNPNLRASEDAKTRFQREAKSVFTLRGEHVARVFDVGRLPSNTPYIVMELLDGCTLKDFVKRDGLPSIDEAVSIVCDASEGIAEAHARGIVHRDLKPDNIFITTRDDGSRLVKVLDFGLSKAILGTGENSITGSGDLLGTPKYMAPEQFGRGGDVSPSTDVWALGVILHWLLTGMVPFDADAPIPLMRAILEDTPRAPSELEPRVGGELDAIVLRCLSRKKEARFSDADALMNALAPFADARQSDTLQMRAPKVALPEEGEAFGDVDTIPDQVGPEPSDEENTLPRRQVVRSKTARMATADVQRRTLKLDERALPPVMLGEGVKATHVKGGDKETTGRRTLKWLRAHGVSSWTSNALVGVCAFIAAALALSILARACH